MPRKTQTREPPRAAGRSPPGDGSDPQWPLDSLTASWLGLPWVNMWMQVWSTWLEQFAAIAAARKSGLPATEERRQDGLPWLPQFDSTVVPLRRRDDLPGAEATKVSMRVRLPAFPWVAAGSNVVAIDTLIPRPLDAPDDPMQTRH